MRFDADALYALLPAIHRLRDAEQGEPLRALVGVLAEQARILEEDVLRLYDDQFVETADSWVLPYIGELVGWRPVHEIPGAVVDRRAEIANTIRYRRRKGTAAVLEELARDVGGWNARVIEFFRILGWTQHVNHVRPQLTYAPDLRRWEPLARLGSGFDTIAHTADVRRVQRGAGRHNIPHVGLFLYRLTAYPLRRVMPAALDDRRFFFNPLGVNTPLFNRPVAETTITHLAEPANVPEPIRRRRLAASLAGEVDDDALYGRSLAIEVDGTPLNASDVRACNLADDAADWAHAPSGAVAVDPELGRIAFPSDRPPPGDVRVTFHHGFPADLGGGAYPRTASFSADLDLRARVALGDDLGAALGSAAAGGVVEIVDSATYATTPTIQPAPGARLELRAAEGERPLLRLGGDLVVDGGADGEVVLDGLLIAGGRLVVPAGSGLRRLVLRHCTLVPGLDPAADGAPSPSLVVEAEHVVVEIARTITGALRVPASGEVVVEDAIVDALDPAAVAFADPDGERAGAHLTLRAVTLRGKVHAASLPLVSNSLLLAELAAGDTWSAPVVAERRQVGCVRFSLVPPAARVPRRYRCQPEHAGRSDVDAARARDPDLSDARAARLRAAAEARLRPLFTDRRYGRPGYFQLAPATPAGIREGADDGAAMGAYHHLHEPQRAANLRIRLDEYLPIGLAAGLFYTT